MPNAFATYAESAVSVCHDDDNDSDCRVNKKFVKESPCVRLFGLTTHKHKHMLVLPTLNSRTSKLLNINSKSGKSYLMQSHKKDLGARKKRTRCFLPAVFALALPFRCNAEDFNSKFAFHCTFRNASFIGSDSICSGDM